MSGAFNSDTYLTIASGLGAHGTLKKPFSGKQVLEMVRQVMAQ